MVFLCALHIVDFVKVLKNQTIRKWPHQTTVGCRDDQRWQILEFCQSVFQLDECEAPIPGSQTEAGKTVVKECDFIS